MKGSLNEIPGINSAEILDKKIGLNRKSFGLQKFQSMIEKMEGNTPKNDVKENGKQKTKSSF